MARVVYHGASGQGDLFHGTKFWLSAKIPLRGTLMEQIQVYSSSKLPKKMYNESLSTDLCDRATAVSSSNPTTKPI